MTTLNDTEVLAIEKLFQRVAYEYYIAAESGDQHKQSTTYAKYTTLRQVTEILGYFTPTLPSFSRVLMLSVGESLYKRGYRQNHHTGFLELIEPTTKDII